MDTAYHARLRKRIADYNTILASSNPPTMIVDSPARRGFVQSGNTPYNMENVVVAGLGGKKKGLAKTLKVVGQFAKPLGKSLKPIKHALMEKAVYELGAPMYQGKTHSTPVMAEYDDEEIPEAYDLGLPALPKGGRQYKQRKQGLAKALRTVGEFVAPLGKTIAPIKKALVARAVQEIGGKRAPSAWIAEVKAVRAEMEKKDGPVSYKSAMQEASRRRKA